MAWNGWDWAVLAGVGVVLLVLLVAGGVNAWHRARPARRRPELGAAPAEHREREGRQGQA